MFTGKMGLIIIFFQPVPYGNEISTGLLPLNSYFPLLSERSDDTIEAVYVDSCWMPMIFVKFSDEEGLCVAYHCNT